MFSGRLIFSGPLPFRPYIRVHGCEIINCCHIFFWSSLASDALLGFLSDPSAEQGLRGEEGRAIIII